MKLKKIFLTLTATVMLASSGLALTETQPVQAANYSNSEVKQVRKFQTAYKKLDRTTNYDQDSIYVFAPNFAEPFTPGTLQSKYIQTSMAFINYYRSLFGLPAEKNLAIDNDNAQLGAAALASVNAKTSLRAHGLIGYKRPSYISEKDWTAAESATLGNINFLESTTGATAGEIVTDLLQDENNISGAGNTGHRALLLSARATKMGIGAAYGKSNGKFYSVENGVFAEDILRPAVKKTVTYPSNNVFPYELLSSDTPWSAYFAGKHISRRPKVYITDLTTGKKYQASKVRNFGTDYYGNGYSAAITFKPNSKMKLVNTHKYRVQIANVYTYTFRLFRQNSTLKQSTKKTTKKKSAKKKTTKKKSRRKKVSKKTRKRKSHKRTSKKRVKRAAHKRR